MSTQTRLQELTRIINEADRKNADPAELTAYEIEYGELLIKDIDEKIESFSQKDTEEYQVITEGYKCIRESWVHELELLKNRLEYIKNSGYYADLVEPTPETHS
jgi:tRNA A22 N-methylase